MQSVPLLTYVNGRGKAEPIRFVLAAAGYEHWNEHFLNSKHDLDQLRATGKLPFGQIPLLEIDGFSITQTPAIIQYLARKHNLYGASEEERIRCDQYFDALRDFDPWLEWAFAESLQDYKNSEVLPKLSKYLPKFEEILKKNKDKGSFLVGSQLTFVDAVLLVELEWGVDCVGEELLKDYPELRNFRERTRALPLFSRFLSSPLHKPPPDEAYVALVKSVFY